LGTAINVLVTCTKRKSRPVPVQLRLGSVPDGPMEARHAIWVERLRSSHDELLPAHALYSGDSWTVVKSFASYALLQLWISSAGYGLLSASSSIHAYSATFDTSDPDSVALREGSRNASRAWWRLLSEWDGPGDAPRSLAELTAACPRSPLLVIASRAYLNAFYEDLALATRSLSDPDLLSIISAGTKSLGALTRHLLPCHSRLQHLVGGSRQSLNPRLARLALSSLRGRKPTCTTFREFFSKLQVKQPDVLRTRRPGLTDGQVRRHIRKALELDRDARPTPLLRDLRDGGLACEQSRFTSLFRAVREELYGT
jgi:hypothetical protein